MKTKTIIEKLQTMLGLFENNKRWCQGAMAKNKIGAGVPVLSKSAECFCLVGAAKKVTRDKQKATWLVNELGKTIRPSTIFAESTVIDFNDAHRTGIAKVRALIKRTIKRLSAGK